MVENWEGVKGMKLELDLVVVVARFSREGRDSKW